MFLEVVRKVESLHEIIGNSLLEGNYLRISMLLMGEEQELAILLFEPSFFSIRRKNASAFRRRRRRKLRQRKGIYGYGGYATILLHIDLFRYFRREVFRELPLLQLRQHWL